MKTFRVSVIAAACAATSLLAACGGLKTDTMTSTRSTVASPREDADAMNEQLPPPPRSASAPAAPPVARQAPPVVREAPPAKTDEEPRAESVREEEAEPAPERPSPEPAANPAPTVNPAPATPPPPPQTSRPTQTPRSQKPPPTPRDSETAPALSAESVHAATPWSRKAQTFAWTKTVAAIVKARLTTLDRARDVSTFCPGYVVAARPYRELCWLKLVGAVAQFESRFEPANTFREPNGVMSVGLLQLSPNECPNAPTLNDLKDPVRNLACGVDIMANLIGRDGYVDGPASRRGAAAYWSTLREPYTMSGYKLGKKPQIIQMTKTYRQVD